MVLPNPRTEGRENWGLDEVKAYLKESYGDNVDAVVAAYQKAYPKMKCVCWMRRIDVMIITIISMHFSMISQVSVNQRLAILLLQ